MLLGDWQVLQSCVELKQQLCDRMLQSPTDPGFRELAPRLRQSTLHNAALATAISRQLSMLVNTQGRSEPVYDRGGHQRADRNRPLVSLRT